MILLQVDAGDSDVASCDQSATYVVSDFYFPVFCCMFTKKSCIVFTALHGMQTRSCD